MKPIIKHVYNRINRLRIIIYKIMGSYIVVYIWKDIKKRLVRVLGPFPRLKRLFRVSGWVKIPYTVWGGYPAFMFTERYLKRAGKKYVEGVHSIEVFPEEMESILTFLENASEDQSPDFIDPFILSLFSKRSFIFTPELKENFRILLQKALQEYYNNSTSSVIRITLFS